MFAVLLLKFYFESYEYLGMACMRLVLFPMDRKVAYLLVNCKAPWFVTGRDQNIYVEQNPKVPNSRPGSVRTRSYSGYILISATNHNILHVYMYDQWVESTFQPIAVSVFR